MASMMMKIRLDASLAEFVSFNTGEQGLYQHAPEYIRDLIRRDFERVKAAKLEKLKASL